MIRYLAVKRDDDYYFLDKLGSERGKKFSLTLNEKRCSFKSYKVSESDFNKFAREESSRTYKSLLGIGISAGVLNNALEPFNIDKTELYLLLALSILGGILILAAWVSVDKIRLHSKYELGEVYFLNVRMKEGNTETFDTAYKTFWGFVILTTIALLVMLLFYTYTLIVCILTATSLSLGILLIFLLIIPKDLDVVRIKDSR